MSWRWLMPHHWPHVQNQRAATLRGEQPQRPPHTGTGGMRHRPRSQPGKAAARPGPRFPGRAFPSRPASPGSRAAAALTLSMMLFTTRGFFSICCPAPVLKRMPRAETSVSPWTVATRRHAAGPRSDASAGPASLPESCPPGPRRSGPLHTHRRRGPLGAPAASRPAPWA